MPRLNKNPAPMKSNHRAQDNLLDQIVSGELAIKPKSTAVALSLKPGQMVMDGCVQNNAIAIAIRDSWKFKPTRPVTIMSAEELDRLSTRCEVVFVGKESDRA